MRRQVCSIAWHIPFKETRYCGTAPSPFLKNRRHLRLSLVYITGFVQILGSKIQDFFQTFSKTIISFSKLKVIKQVINTTQEQSLFSWCSAHVRMKLNKIWPKQIIIKHTKSASRSFEKKLKTLYHLYFPDFFQAWKIAEHFSRLFQEFKTLHEPFRTFYARWNVSV